MTDAVASPAVDAPGSWRGIARLLWYDKFATASAVFLALVLFCALFGPWLLGDAANAMNLRQRNAPPLSLEQGWLYLLGGDALGRSILARLIVAAQNTVLIAASAVFLSLIVGGLLGLIAGYSGRGLGNLIMRFADILMSFPSLLMAMIVLYVLEPRALNVVLVLAITRLPVYMRTTRAEVLDFLG
ncbi:MAG: ABC transporter permease subunit, partial [Geminicoccaceae bacterium]|nr:ABC transporter permease subunit [Geminicoccaceae bacterium]